MSKILILCVDRDDDIGRKAGLKSPVIGREENINAALKLAEKDPEDSDINTIFGAINLYDELIAKGIDAEIVTVSGDINIGTTSDLKIAEELDFIKKKFRSKEVIVVGDGAEDEAILPLIESRFKINMIKRIVVKQSQNLENTYYIIKQFLNDPKISRVLFIPLGLASLIYAISIFVNYPQGAKIAILAFLGFYFLMKGFGLENILDEFTVSLKRTLYEGKVSFVTNLIALIMVILGIVQGFQLLWNYYNRPIMVGYIILLTAFIYGAVWWMVAGGVFVGIGRFLDSYLDSEVYYKALVYPFFIIATGLIVWGGSVFILSLQEGFHISQVDAPFYLAGAIVGAIFISLSGIMISSRMKKPRQDLATSENTE
jgi:putative membrane protein